MMTPPIIPKTQSIYVMFLCMQFIKCKCFQVDVEKLT